MDWTRGRTLGRGSSATVSIAASRLSGDVFAVKSMELPRSKLLQREQRILSAVCSAHVIGYRGCNVTSENGKLVFNLCMEYAAGGTLKQRGRLPEASIRANTRAVLLGLRDLHSSRIVHCDIKSENILITGDGLKIGDLGCSRVAGDFSGAVRGTPAFMAPEVARGEEQGFAADVWALGCTVIEMATGRAPWVDVPSPVSAVYRIGFSEEVPEVPAWVSGEAKDFLGKCLMRDPVKRWSVGQLLGHPFVNEACPSQEEEAYGSSSGSPTSVLDHSFWVSSIKELYPSIRQKSLNSPRERIGLLSDSRSPNWVCDEDWVTVRHDSTEDAEEEEEDEDAESPTSTATLTGHDPGMRICGGEHTSVMDTLYVYDDSCESSLLKYNCMDNVLCGNLNLENFNDTFNSILYLFVEAMLPM